MHSTILIFLDGVGIGKPDSTINPFFKYPFKTFTELFGATPSLENQKLSKDGRFLFPTDALMDMPDLPQSGTGQTSIFCGVNAARILGNHFGPFPHSKLVPIIKVQNIFQQFKLRKKKVTFVNAYPKVFFEYIESGKKRLSVTSLSCNLSGVPLKNSTDLRKGKALSAEIDNYMWVNKLSISLKVIKPETAAKRLFKLAEQNHFTLFEHFLTDHLGHGRNKEILKDRLNVLDDFLFYVLKNLPKDFTLIICSDHGNLEDISVKSHTLNPALTITAGKHAERLSNRITNLSHIRDAILELY
ncbi:MAG: metalloenzyme [Ignavibacteriales bacterium]|nr:metalloenzyme [Ignavibacteriota bacterium]MCB0747206.1 metalloenzyme [Ignavibacteriota bacterium]MCB9250549.1 metalloenzyme [Ignavibacteriales bacterium]